ncbi:Mis6-domain-containing protein [Choiromyces venosus 120613-1]|uniref:Mis6-domain-containing protein n=1 Tax=Choiromyces venosus 120613-1 TaxID=1336337 RepID=A0A3N4K974_9PEZI|nr:Mis6-domain-containing protein [Choiromyces venosus 120613-1]
MEVCCLIRSHNTACSLCPAASIRNSLSKNRIAGVIDSISQHATVRGLTNDSLEALINVLTSSPCYLDQPSVGSIVKILFPRRKVSENVVVKVVGSLGQGQSKPSLATQALLLRWLVMVYDVLESYDVLSQLYGVLFNLLDMITLRGHLCHILSSLTRRKHVKPFRIQNLLVLKRNLGNEQPLLGLLQVYKDYYPDVIVGETAAVRAGVFSHPNIEWMQRLLLIQESNADDCSGPSDSRSSFRIVRKIGGQGMKRQKTNHIVIPEVHTFRAIEASVTLEEVEDVSDFVKKLDKLELPNQLVAVLEDPLLRTLISLKPSDGANLRINNWLATCLSSELHSPLLSNIRSADRTEQFLSKILEYTRSTRRLLPAVEDFLKNYLRTWDGNPHAETLLGLLCFLPIREFEELQSNCFALVDRQLKGRGETSITKLIAFYTELIRQWAITYGNQAQEFEFSQEESLALRKVLSHVGQICLAGLVNFPGSNLLADAILCFYECTCAPPWENGLFRIVLPPDQVVFYFVFSGDVMTLSRICGILSRYKRGFELSLRQAQSGDSNGAGEYPRDYVNHFNGFLMDICNLVWRNRAFKSGGSDSKQDQNALGCTLKNNVVLSLQKAVDAREESLLTLFSLSHSAVLAQFSAECFRMLENTNDSEMSRTRHAGPVTQKSLQLLASNGGLKITYSDFRVAVLRALGKKGLNGIWDFMHSTMISLIQLTSAADSSRATSKG